MAALADRLGRHERGIRPGGIGTPQGALQHPGFGFGVRKALPDTIKATFGLDPNVIDNRLLTSAGEDANALSLDSSVQPANVARVLSDTAV